MTTSSLQEYRKHIRLMGSAFEFVVVAEETRATEAIAIAIGEVQRIEKLLTEFSDDSYTSRINRAAGIQSVQVEEEVYAILQRCKHLSMLTQGAFDITAGILKKLYNFKGDNFSLPDKKVLEEAKQRTGFAKIDLQPDNRVYLSVPGMHISFAAIGKGYAADCAKSLLMQKGVGSGVINASGDLTVWGTRADGTPWKVGVADPQEPSRILAWIPVHNASVATSGNYEQYFDKNGVRYSHNIDPKSGLPVTGIRSVTIVSPRAELSDALATAVTVMGAKVGIHFIEQLPGTHALIIDDRNKIITSRHLKLTMEP